ncbi:MAG: hypothetical protein L0Y55_07505 [Anaerolineales bacterium]|nr:hypothetical protein [Anaerolineales bacterium]
MKRKRLVIFGIVLVQLLLMGSAFVGGRMLGEQNRRTNRPAGSVQLPAQLPKDPAAGTGSVQQIQGNIITLGGRGFGGPGGQSSNTQTEIAITADTKFYKNTSMGQPGNSGGGQTQVQVADATLADVKVGNNVIVWGTKNGQRITAQVIYIQTAGR